MNRWHNEASRSLMAGSGTSRRKSSRFSILEPRTLVGGEKNASRASDATDFFVFMLQCRTSSLIGLYRRIYLVYTCTRRSLLLNIAHLVNMQPRLATPTFKRWALSQQFSSPSVRQQDGFSFHAFECTESRGWGCSCV